MSVLADTKHRIIPVMRYFFCILKARILIEGETDISYNALCDLCKQSRSRYFVEYLNKSWFNRRCLCSRREKVKLKFVTNR